MSKAVDMVNHPPHYTWIKDVLGIEVIELTRHLDFDLGNAVKYLLRCGHKDNIIQDLEKANWYIWDEIKNLPYIYNPNSLKITVDFLKLSDHMSYHIVEALNLIKLAYNDCDKMHLVEAAHHIDIELSTYYSTSHDD